MSDLRVVVRTPRGVALDLRATSVRVPTESGHVGLRPRAEPTVMAVEPGLVLAREGATTWYVGTAGGLLSCDRSTVLILTPLSVSSQDVGAVVGDLEHALSEPGLELQARAALRRLESGILGELREPRWEGR